MAEILLVLEHVNRRARRRERQFRDRLDPLALSDQELLRKYRFPRHELITLFEELDPMLRRRTRRSQAIPTHTQVLITLRILGTGSFQAVVGDTAGLTQASVSRVIAHVTRVLSNKAVDEIKMPSTRQEMRKTCQDFFRLHGFPRVIGAIDGTHVAIKAPIVGEDRYVNRKNFHSLNIQVTCNADRIITNFCARFPGSTHDAFIWNASSLQRRMAAQEFGNYLLLGDSGYPLQPFLMTPFRNPGSVAEEKYNSAHTRTRVIVEQTFGVLKNRFRCLHKSGGHLQYTPLKCVHHIVSCILLHNRCIRRRIPPPLDEIVMDEIGAEDVNDLGRAALQNNTGRATRDEIVREWFTV